MEFKFDANQEYQVRAIESVTSLLEGQQRNQSQLNLSWAEGFAAISNRLDLDEAALLANLRKVQAENGLEVDDSLKSIEDSIETANGQQNVTFPNFSIEMETGTGKTYVYIRTTLELHQRYGFCKFIVVVPSLAIREGVLKTFQITEKHLKELYGNLPYRYYVYDSGNLAQVRQFAVSPNVEFMVMTLASFNKAANVIHQTTDRLQGETPVHLVQATRPILILDEPQNMESEASIKALAVLNPLFALRYSATHRNPYNLVHRLTPFEAYRQGLVKRIEVAGVERQDDENQPFIQVNDIRTQGSKLTARLTVHKRMADGTVKEKVIVVRPDDNLEPKTGRSEYAGFTVDEISLMGGYVRFTNGVELQKGEATGADKEAIFDAQIRFTVEEHLRKQHRLRNAGIKVLSLFFIDRVDNYQPEDGVIRRLFSRTFDELKSKYGGWQEITAEEVQAAYFAERRNRAGEHFLEDSKSGETERDREAYDLIMRDKERLLSFDEPTCFIFSHSALREGWDNPNVFQICTLNQTASEIKKRQEVGRGVRLAVNQEGDRVREPESNVLTVVANESYDRYVGSLQAEIVEEYGLEGAPPKPANARRRKTARRQKKYFLSPDFKELWERIKHKTRYAVVIDSARLVSDVLLELDEVEIRPPRVTITKAEIRVAEEDVFAPLLMSGAKTVLDLAGRYPLPPLVDMVADLLERSTPRVKVTRHTILEIIRRARNRQAAVDNPHGFATVCAAVLKEKLAAHLVDGIKYEKLNEWYEMTQFNTEIETWEDYLIPAPHSLYDHVEFESDVERRFVEDLEKLDYVKLYVKLPNWFTVQTPVGEYNPDWAIVMEDRDEHGDPVGERLYLVRETKDTTDLEQLRPDEKRKIICGKQHFVQALGVDFKVVTKASELP